MVAGIKMSNTNHYHSYFQKIEDNKDYAIYEALQHINEKYYGEKKQPKFSDVVISSMTDELDDYSNYWNVERNERYQNFVDGSYIGKGLEIVKIMTSFYISKILSSGPSALIGLKKGDRVIKIGGNIITEISLDSLYNIFDSERDVNISIERNGTDTLDFQLSNSTVDIDPVSLYAIDQQVLYAKIRTFSIGVFKSFMDKLESYQNQENLIIDLRGNPGGVLDETTKILNQLVNEPSQNLVSTINNKDELRTYTSNGRGFLNMKNLAVLIDQKSASASEILAGALQDLDKAVIIGEKSYGKGEIQQNYLLSNGASISLTVGEYLLPTGRTISRRSQDTSKYYSLKNNRELKSNNGVDPDISVDESCSIQDKRALKNLCFKYLYDHNWFSREDLKKEEIDRMNEELLINHQESCELAVEQFVFSFLLEYDYLNNTISSNLIYADNALKIAYDLITEDQVREHLGYK